MLMFTGVCYSILDLKVVPGFESFITNVSMFAVVYMLVKLWNLLFSLGSIILLWGCYVIFSSPCRYI